MPANESVFKAPTLMLPWVNEPFALTIRRHLIM